MLLTILVILIIFLLGVLIGMILESSFENANFKEPEQPKEEEVEIIEINDPDNYFIPF